MAVKALLLFGVIVMTRKLNMRRTCLWLRRILKMIVHRHFLLSYNLICSKN